MSGQSGWIEGSALALIRPCESAPIAPSISSSPAAGGSLSLPAVEFPSAACAFAAAAASPGVVVVVVVA